MINQMFINLPVKELKKSVDFFTNLGFSFNQQFTDENATCMIIGENMFAMLIVEKFFKTFIKKEISDSSKSTEVITALSVNSRQEVDEFINKVLQAGGKLHNDTLDYGWMYNRSFEDIDGHIWEVFTMDMNAMPKEQ